jgi:hypothetical protein
MRFDEIDLIGDFKINGATGTSGKVLGMTMGTIGWITVTSGGGGGGGARGAQGPTGPSPTQDVQTSRIGIGYGSSLCQLNDLAFSKLNQLANILSPGTDLGVNNCNVGLISSNCNSYIGWYSCRSTIISSYRASLCFAQNSSIFSSYNSGSGGIGGSCNSIIGSSFNSSEYGICSSSNSVILSSCIGYYGSMFNSQNSSIISSVCGCMGNFYTTKNNIILASCGGVMSGTASENAIIASIDNSSTTLNSCQSVVIGTYRSRICNSRSSAVIGGGLNSISGSTQSVILGGGNLTLNNKSNTTMVPNLVVNKIKFIPCPTSTPPNLTNGQIWYRNNQLYVRFNGATGTFSLVT